MTTQQKQSIIQLRDEYIYRSRQANDAMKDLQLAMQQVGLTNLELTLVEPQPAVPPEVAK